MGNVEIAQAIRAVARLLRPCAATLRKSPDAAALERLILRSDPDDLEMLGRLLTGKLNPGQGQHGVAHKRLAEAERAARSYARSKDVSLDKAAEAVAGAFGLEVATLVNKLRRSRRPAPKRRRSTGR